MSKTKQVSIVLPRRVIERAEKISKTQTRPDGMRLSVAAILREWTINGMAKNEQ